MARDIFNCRVPIRSAVGHETDTTISDYVADLRAPTPSAAAELAVWDYRLYENQLYDYRMKLVRRMEQQISLSRMRLSQYQTRFRYLHPGTKLREQRQRMVDIQDEFCTVMVQKLQMARHRLAIQVERMNGLSPLRKLNQGYAYVEKQCEDEKQTVRKTDQVREGDALSIYVSDGVIHAEVTDTQNLSYEI